MANLSSTDKPIVEDLLANFYQTIKPYLGGTTYVSGFTPVGTIISVMATAAPQHYLACDGTAYSISDYPELAEHIKSNFGSYNFFGGNGTTTFAVPDLRGEFLRGTGINSHENSGNGADVGVHQSPTLMPQLLSYAGTDIAKGRIQINRDIPINSTATGDQSYGDIDSYTTRASYVTTANENTKETLNKANVTTGIGRVTARPTNTSVLYCIATKDIYIDARNDYSTTEKVVGSWIDGKPLYQRTVVIDLSSTTPTSTERTSIEIYDPSSLSPDMVMVNHTASFVGSDSTTWGALNHINNYTSNGISYSAAVINQTTKKVYIVTQGNSYYYQACGKTGSKLVLTIQYTKTTD